MVLCVVFLDKIDSVNAYIIKIHVKNIDVFFVVK